MANSAPVGVPAYDLLPGMRICAVDGCGPMRFGTVYGRTADRFGKFARVKWDDFSFEYFTRAQPLNPGQYPTAIGHYYLTQPQAKYNF